MLRGGGELNAHEGGREKCWSCMRLARGGGGVMRIVRIGGGGSGRCNVELFPFRVPNIQTSETRCGWDVSGCSEFRRN